MSILNICARWYAGTIIVVLWYWPQFTVAGFTLVITHDDLALN